MIRNIYHKPRIDWLTLFMLAWLVVIMLSCNVIKGKRSTRATVDSVARKTTSVVDTGSGGATRKITTDSKSEFDWTKLTLQYPRDTNVTNIYNYPQKPATVIYETGRGSSEAHTIDSSSEWFKNAITSLNSSVDSLSKRLQESEKNKETAPSIWFLIGVVFIIIVVCLAAYTYLSKFKVVKRVI